MKIKTITIASSVVVIVTWILGWVLPQFFLVKGERGEFGDMFGAVNALFSGFAFLGVIVAILLQKEELSLQRKELEETRNELKKSADAQKEAVHLHVVASKLDALSSMLNSVNSQVNIAHDEIKMFPGSMDASLALKKKKALVDSRRAFEDSVFEILDELNDLKSNSDK